jgi:phosphatidate cytidylyltransferase
VAASPVAAEGDLAGRARPAAAAVPLGRDGRPLAGDPTIAGARPASAPDEYAPGAEVDPDPAGAAAAPAPGRRTAAAERRARAAALASGADGGAGAAGAATGTRRTAGAQGARRAAGGPGGPGRTGGQGAGRDVPVAIGVGVLFAAVALILFKVGPRATMVLVTAVLVVAAIEFFSSTRQAGYQPAVLLGLAATAAMALAAYWRGEAAYPLVVFLTVVFGLLWHLVGAGEERPVPNLGVTLLGVAYVGGLGSFAALLLKFPNGIGMLLGAVVATVAYDVGGYAVGRNLGRAPLAPDVSPNKTWEGLIGGIALTVIATTLIVGKFPGIHPFDTVGDALKLGLVAAVAAPLGDLCESMLKRDLGVKDMGSTLPAHGGLLDRFDALLFVLPATYYLVRLLDLA